MIDRKELQPEEILDAMNGSHVGKMMMLMVMVKAGKLSIDKLMYLCLHHHSASGKLSQIDEIFKLYAQTDDKAIDCALDDSVRVVELLMK